MAARGMLKMYALLVFLLRSLLPAQSQGNRDVTRERFIKRACSGEIFTRTEELPKFIIEKKDYEDSVASWLKRNDAFPKNKKIAASFVLTKESQLIDLTIVSGNPGKPDIFKQAILYFSELWVPALQHGHLVCSVVKLEMIFTANKLTVLIKQ